MTKKYVWMSLLVAMLVTILSPSASAQQAVRRPSMGRPMIASRPMGGMMRGGAMPMIRTNRSWAGYNRPFIGGGYGSIYGGGYHGGGWQRFGRGLLAGAGVGIGAGLTQALIMRQQMNAQMQMMAAPPMPPQQAPYYPPAPRSTDSVYGAPPAPPARIIEPRPGTRNPSPAEIQPTCPSGQVMFRNDTGSDVDVSAPGVSMFIMVAGGASCRDWVSGLEWEANKHSTMATEGSGEATGSRLVMSPSAICFEGDGRGVIHLRNSCSQ